MASKAMGSADGESAMQNILDMGMPDGTFKSSATSTDKGSLRLAKVALHALHAYSDSSKVSSAIGKALDSGLQLLPSGEVDSVTAADPTLLPFLKGREKVDKSIRGKWKQLVAITQSLLALQYAGPEDGYETLAMAIEALQVVVALKASPLAITLGPLAGSRLDFTVTDAFGTSVTPAAMECKSVKKFGRDNSLFSGPCLGGIDLSSQSEQLTAGRFVVDLDVVVEEGGKKIPLSRYFVIKREVEVVNVHAGVSDAKSASSLDLKAVPKQNKWSGGLAKSEAGDNIHISFALQQPSGNEKRFQKPHQCFLRFTHIASGTNAFFVAQGDGAWSAEGVTGLKYKASIVLSKEIETFSNLSGDYLMSILVSDVSVEGVEFVIGSLEIAVPPKVDKILPLYQTSLLHKSDNTLGPLPEIEHKMRPPAKQASVFMSTIFTILTMLPLAVFLLFVISLRPNFKRFGSPSSYLFVVAIGGSLVLYLAYWTAMPGASFYETIKYLCFIVLATAVIGRSAIADMSDKQK